VVEKCRTDSFGGPEGGARLVLDFAEVRAQTDLSDCQNMINAYAIRFERGRISGAVYDDHLFTLVRGTSKPEIVRPSHGVSLRMRALSMMSNFVAAVAGEAQPLVSGRDVPPSIRAITEGYRQAREFAAPWLPMQGA
jgi:hypothetical protein